MMIDVVSVFDSDAEDNLYWKSCHGQNDDCDLVFHVCIINEKHRKTMMLAKMIIKMSATISN